MKRTREELTAAVATAEQTMKTAQSAYYALKRELDTHPDTRREEEDRGVATLRAELPDYLYHTLVTQAAATPNDVLRFLCFDTSVEWAGDDPTNVLEVSVQLGPRMRTFEVLYSDGVLELDDVNEALVAVPFCHNVQQAWARAYAANKKDKAAALAALVYAAVMHTGKVKKSKPTLLRDVYSVEA